MKYLLEDTNKIVTEDFLREYLYTEEVNDLLVNKELYLKGYLWLGHQMECIEKAINGDIKEVIKMLEINWNVPIKECE